jgi:hypothetical protein
MSAVLKKLDEIAQRAAANHGLNIVEPISEIYGTGSFFKGVAACEPGLVIDCAKTTRPTRRRSVAFLSLCYAGWDEYWQRCSDANAAVEKAWEERASAHLALHPEDGQSAWFKADWDESKNWLRCKFDDPEYNRATAATKPPKTMEEPCVWAVREWCARAGTANPLVVKERNYRGITGKKFDDDLRELFAPLDDEAIAEVLKGWASKLTWDQIRNCALPEDEEIMKHVLLKGVGRFKHFEIRGNTFAEQQGPPADSVLIWSSNEPGMMPSVRLTSVYPEGVGSSQRKRPAAGSSVGDAAGAAPHSKAARTRPPATPAELYELGHAAWLIAHARRWEAIAQACVRALLTPAHPLHAEMLLHGSTPDPLQCVEWRASVEQSPAMRAVCEESLRGWPQEATFEHGIESVGPPYAFLPCAELRRLPGRTEPFGSQSSYWALRQHCAFKQAGQRAHEGMKADRLHELMVSPPSEAEDAMQLDRRVIHRRAMLLSEPPEAALKAIGALQTQGLKELKAELKRVHASVDGMAGLAEHTLALHEPDRSFQNERFRKAIEGPHHTTGHATEGGTPPHPMRLVMQAGPICGTLLFGSRINIDRLHIALPEKHCLGRYHTDGSDPEPEYVQLRDAILGSGSPPLEPAERRQALCPRADDLALPHLEELVPGVPARLRTPVDVQRMVNECVLSLYVSRIGLRAATSIQLRKAAGILHLPASVAVAFQWLADPQGVGIRAWRWERRRNFFLLRARGHTLLSAMPNDLFQKITMLADDD